jgi:hypothetical protein
LQGASGAARVLAGAADVIVQMETDLIEPQLLVDIKKIAEMRQIVAESGGLRIGAAVPACPGRSSCWTRRTRAARARPERSASQSGLVPCGWTIAPKGGRCYILTVTSLEP